MSKQHKLTTQVNRTSEQHKLTTQVNRTSEQHKLTTEISKKSETKQSEKKQSSNIIGLLLSPFQIYSMYTFFCTSSWIQTLDFLMIVSYEVSNKLETQKRVRLHSSVERNSNVA
jgi:hypothetical protein